MLSIPPATMMPLWPSWMFWVASIIAFMPLAQTLLIVVASVVSGILQCISLSVGSFFFKKSQKTHPAPIPTCLAGDCPTPAWTTLPI